MRWRDDFQQQLVSGSTASGIEPEQLAFLPFLQFRRIVRMIARQAFDDMRQWPAIEFHADVVIAFKFQRARPRRFDRPSDPVVTVSQLRQDSKSEPIVDQHSEPWILPGNTVQCLQGQLLELADAFLRATQVADQLVELAAMVDRQH